MNAAIFERRLAEKNKTKKNLSEELGIRPQRVSDLLAGRLKGYKYRFRIARYLDVAEDLLFPEDGDQDSCQS
jgi:transcriptional regulator with XRE-family HTH domain